MEKIAFERRGQVGLLTLNRPERLNAIDYPMLRELRTFFDDRHRDLDCRIIIVTGEGRGFCAGLDLYEEHPPGSWQKGLGSVQELYTFQEDIADLVVKMRRAPQPLIACVNGPAAGGGLSIAVACDVRIASPTAAFACAFINLGITGCDVGSSYHLPKIVGSSLAADMIYSGRLVNADEALKAQLVMGVFPPDQLLDEGLAMAKRWIERSSPFGLRLGKEVLNETITGVSLENALKLENRSQVLAMQTEDSEESRAAWKDRRTPAWRDA
ncbi:MAG TPA: enoyl-CoA hydratase/isomerase family protein [Dehalococcoidia bacterium]|nr:enoyl-CoA hydratase/isomerase family protein [Dehalococcoidia bacterium]